jgi:hypothetical protein
MERKVSEMTEVADFTMMASAGEPWPAAQGAAFGGAGVAGVLSAVAQVRDRVRDRLEWALFKARLRIEDRLSRAYDLRHDVETAQGEALAACGVAPEDIERGNSVYRATWGSLIRASLARLRIDHSRYTFIDYGSGKGKAMLMAADYPYQRIVGLEYSDRLHAIASANCQSFHRRAQKCHVLEPALVDVLNYEPPPGPIVCFMCNPFDEATLHAMFDRWRASFDAGEREIRILYLNMRTIREKSSALRAQHWLRRIAQGKRYVLLAPRAT